MFNKHLFNVAQYNAEPFITHSPCGGARIAPHGSLVARVDAKRSTGGSRVTPHGSATRQINVNIQTGEAFITPVGSITKKIAKTKTGNAKAMPHGVFSRQIKLRAGEGSIVLHGSLPKWVEFTIFAGNAKITPTGSKKKKTAKQIARECNIDARLSKHTSRHIFSDVLPRGTVSEKFSLTIILGGNIAITDELKTTISRGHQKTVGSTVITPKAILSKLMFKGAGGASITPSRNTYKAWRIKTGNAIITPTKASVKTTGKKMQDTITPIVSIGKHTVKLTGKAVVIPVKNIAKGFYFAVGRATMLAHANLMKCTHRDIVGVIKALGNVKTRYENQEPIDEETLRLKLSRLLHALKDPNWR